MDIFCYADKFAILTNGLGIVRHISFIDDDDFKSSHPEMPVEKKSDSPDEDKSVGDASALKPVLTDFFSLHPNFHPDTFLGDSAFDSADIYGFLINDFHFSKAFPTILVMKVRLRKLATISMVIQPVPKIHLLPRNIMVSQEKKDALIE